MTTEEIIQEAINDKRLRITTLKTRMNHRLLKQYDAENALGEIWRLNDEISALEIVMTKAKAFDILNERFEFIVSGDAVYAYGRYEDTWNDITNEEAKTLRKVLE